MNSPPSQKVSSQLHRRSVDVDSVNDNDAADLLGDFTRNPEHAPNLVHTYMHSYVKMSPNLTSGFPDARQKRGGGCLNRPVPRFGLDEIDAEMCTFAAGMQLYKRFEIGESGIYLLLASMENGTGLICFWLCNLDSTLGKRVRVMQLV